MAQIALRSDALFGTVAVGDWGSYGVHMQSHHARRSHAEHDLSALGERLLAAGRNPWGL